MKSSRTPLILLAIFAALVGGLLLQNAALTDSPMPIGTAAPAITPLPTGDLLRVFPDLAVLDIQAIRLEDSLSGDSFTMVRDDAGRWSALDQASPLDPEAATAIARTIVLLPYGRSLNIIPTTDFESFGFEPAGGMLIQVVLWDGGGHIIAVGGLSPDAPVYFALVDERDEIFLIERGAVDFLKRFLYSSDT